MVNVVMKGTLIRDPCFIEDRVVFFCESNDCTYFCISKQENARKDICFLHKGSKLLLSGKVSYNALWRDHRLYYLLFIKESCLAI